MFAISLSATIKKTFNICGCLFSHLFIRSPNRTVNGPVVYTEAWREAEHEVLLRWECLSISENEATIDPGKSIQLSSAGWEFNEASFHSNINETSHALWYFFNCQHMELVDGDLSLGLDILYLKKRTIKSSTMGIYPRHCSSTPMAELIRVPWK